ncbi:MAG: hypothetical protein RJA25_508 [Bacteroidota bacterium]|jgi:hypothetical protein
MSTLIKRCTKITSKRKLKLLSFASLRSLRKNILIVASRKTNHI